MVPPSFVRRYTKCKHQVLWRSSCRLLTEPNRPACFAVTPGWFSAGAVKSFQHLGSSLCVVQRTLSRHRHNKYLFALFSLRYVRYYSTRNIKVSSDSGGNGMKSLCSCSAFFLPSRMIRPISGKNGNNTIHYQVLGGLSMKRHRIFISLSVILLLSLMSLADIPAQADAATTTAAAAAKWSNQYFADLANELAPEIIAITGRTFLGRLTVKQLSASQFRQAVAEELALTTPGFSTNDALRRSVYAAVQTLAIRYEMATKRIIVDPDALEKGLALLDINDADRVNVTRLLLASELVRALDDQYYDLRAAFRRGRDPEYAAGLRAITDGHGSYLIGRIAAIKGISKTCRIMADNWASGYLIKATAHSFPGLVEQDSLKILGRTFLNYYYVHEGVDFVARIFRHTPQSLAELYNPAEFLARSRLLTPQRLDLESALTIAATGLGLQGFQRHWMDLRAQMSYFGVPLGTLDNEIAMVATGLGLILSDARQSAEIKMLVLSFPIPCHFPLDEAMARCGAVIQQVAALEQATYQSGNLSLLFGFRGEAAVCQGTLQFSGKKETCPVITAAGIKGYSMIMLAGRGITLDRQSVMEGLQAALDRVECP